MLVGLFVAESSGSVVSDSMVSDAIAKVDSSNCSLLPLRLNKFPIYDPPSGQAARYAPLGSDGCNDFYDQSIGFTESSNDTYPFSGNVRGQGRYTALTFDTGYVYAKNIGLNAAQSFYFGRRTTCAPLMPDGQEIRIYDDGQLIIYKAYNCLGSGLARYI